ncbi:unannotated protein [freshwater metagenome]|uniref:Unannotated protein n=1 Tax=freshwater metagenome TaxID=449393 RepID=A0A6J6TZP3_9ZZZZ
MMFAGVISNVPVSGFVDKNRSVSIPSNSHVGVCSLRSATTAGSS